MYKSTTFTIRKKYKKKVADDLKPKKSKKKVVSKKKTVSKKKSVPKKKIAA